MFFDDDIDAKGNEKLRQSVLKTLLNMICGI